MPNHRYRSARYIVNNKTHKINNIDSAIQVLRLMGSDDAEIWSGGARRLVTGALIRFLADYRDYVENVEFGCKELLLQAARSVGEKKHDR